MSFKRELSFILSRKIISASFSGSIFAILLGLFAPDPFDAGIHSFSEYMEAFILVVPAYLMYSFPVILLYGTVTSTISDYLARFLSNYTKTNLEIYFSLTLHIIFGFILLWYSLLASFLFFITDYFLSKKDINKWNNSLKSFAVPILVWVLCIGSLHIMEIFR